MNKDFKKQSVISKISGAKADTKKLIPEEETYSERTQILLKKSTKEELKEYAWKNRKSLNGLINELLEKYIASEKRKEQKALEKAKQEKETTK